MLDSLWRHESAAEENQSSFLNPSDLLDVLKRRWLVFAVPFVIIAEVGIFAALLWPPVYLSEARILIESQQIPSELVRPTVSQMANERIQVMEQRIMTRDRLLNIANKHQVFAGRQGQLTSTEMLDRMRERTQIKPLELKLPASRSPNARPTIAFTVGYEHQDPQVAMRVANEFVTLMLEEDVRTRTNYASETTKFLDREVKRLETELNNTDVQIAEVKKRQISAASAGAPSEATKAQLFQLRSDLLQKAANYSESHPDMKMIQAKIAALEKMLTPNTELGGGLEVLERNRDSLQKALELATNKLTLARMGESLERGQQSEKLEVIEQATVPQKPVRPNRSKVIAAFIAIALIVGGGLAFGLEMLDGTIRRNADLFQIIDRKLVVSLPYIQTKSEAAERRKRFLIEIGLILAVPSTVAVAGIYLFPFLQKVVNSSFGIVGLT